MPLTLTSKDPALLVADALVVATASTDDGVVLVGADALPVALRSLISRTAVTLGITGAADEVRKVPTAGEITAPVLVLTGLGKQSDSYDPETLRRAAGAATRELAGSASVALALPADGVAHLAAVAEGALLGAYSFARYRDAKVAAKSAPVTAIEIVTPLVRDGDAKAAV
ncbi:M17 family peptidase N-terminal domain-containing protein, partial [Pengzhenrongella sp.]|uniref:M17 family peptidase N-terminal domain-containing protein n=1 Tax=Pengzhenrongella sp. TaxID=2888820 RepID=UPI002F93E93E